MTPSSFLIAHQARGEHGIEAAGDESHGFAGFGHAVKSTGLLHTARSVSERCWNDGIFEENARVRTWVRGQTLYTHYCFDFI